MHGNNQLQCDTQLSDNSIPETASSRQSDVIKSRGYLIHVPCVHTQIAYIGRIRICLSSTRAKSTRVIRGWTRRGRGNRWFETRRIPNHRCVSVQGKKSGEGFKTAKSIPRDESNVNLSALFRRGVKPWRKMAAEGRGWVTSSPAFSLHVFAKEKTRIYFRSRILPTEGIKSFSSPFPYLFIYLPYPFLLFSHPRQIVRNK